MRWVELTTKILQVCVTCDAQREIGGAEGYECFKERSLTHRVIREIGKWSWVGCRKEEIKIKPDYQSHTLLRKALSVIPAMRLLLICTSTRV